MKVEDGGPAFARAPVRMEFSSGDVEYYEGYEGMSMRDYFAATALNAILANGELVTTLRKKYGPRTTPHIADTAYEFADAMIEARDK